MFVMRGCLITDVRLGNPCNDSADDRARRFVPHRTPCTESTDDRAGRFQPHCTPCTYGADDRAGRLSPHRTPCTESAGDRARRMSPHRTPCTESAGDRADKRCTPLYFDRCFTPCSHGPFVGGALFRFVPFFVASSPSLSVSSTSPYSLRVTLTFGRQIVVDTSASGARPPPSSRWPPDIRPRRRVLTSRQSPRPKNNATVLRPCP